MSDLIDRQAAIDGLDGHYIERRNLNDWQAGWNAALDWMGSTYLDEFPSAQFDKDIDVPSNDTISRQAAIDALENSSKPYVWQGAEIVRNLPPAQPEPHDGEWILHESPDGGEQYECSRCGVLWEFNDGTPEDNEAYFCPNCGAKMTTSK